MTMRRVSEQMLRVEQNSRIAERQFLLYVSSVSTSIGTTGRPLPLPFALQRSVLQAYRLVATTPLPSHHPLLHWPLSFTLDARRMRQDDDNKESNTRYLNDLFHHLSTAAHTYWHLPLALRLLSEKSRPSRSPSSFKPYIDFLPSAYPHHPLFFNTSDIQSLQYAPLQAQIGKRASLLHQMIPIIQSWQSKAPLDPFHGVTITAELLAWSLCSVFSRAFSFVLSDKEHPDKDQSIHRMVPLVDLCNHSFEPNCRLNLDTDGVLVLSTTRDIALGEVLCVSYGDYSNDDLLLNYGFILANNRFDQIDVKFKVDHVIYLCSLIGISLAPTSDQLLEIAHLLSNEKPLIISQQSIDARMFEVVRLLLTTAIKSPKCANDEYTNAHHLQVLVVEVVKLWIKSLIASFPTTMDDDLKQLKTTQSSVAELSCKYRISKKQLLHVALEKLPGQTM